MPYASKAQARAVLANTSSSNPKHSHARSEAKKTIKRGLAAAAMPSKKRGY